MDYVTKKVKSMSASGVRRMFEMALKLKDPINLTLGLPDFDVPEEIKEEAIKHIKEGFNKYTPTTGILPLREAVSKKLNEKNKIKTTPDNVLITSSVSGALSILLTVILEKGDEIILFDPYFVCYKQLVLQNEAKPVIVDTNKDFSINFEELENKITSKTKAILINSPNNPTGKVYSKEELEKLVQIAKKHELLIISDEIYEDFVFDKNNKHFSIGSIYDNTITVNGFSKSHGMPGWRVGYLTGPQHLVEECIKVQQFNFVCAPTPFQFAAIKAIDYDVSDFVKRYEVKRDIIYNSLKDKYELEKPQGAFYAYVKYPYDGDKFIEDCLKNNLLVVPGNVFSEKNTHFRISFATKDDVLKKAVEVLNGMVK